MTTRRGTNPPADRPRPPPPPNPPPTRGEPNIRDLLERLDALATNMADLAKATREATAVTNRLANLITADNPELEPEAGRHMESPG